MVTEWAVERGITSSGNEKVSFHTGLRSFCRPAVSHRWALRLTTAKGSESVTRSQFGRFVALMMRHDSRPSQARGGPPAGASELPRRGEGVRLSLRGRDCLLPGWGGWGGGGEGVGGFPVADPDRLRGAATGARVWRGTGLRTAASFPGGSLATLGDWRPDLGTGTGRGRRERGGPVLDVSESAP